MKRIISILTALLIIVLSLSVSVFAENTVNLSLSSETVYAGDEFTLNLFISDNSKMSGAVIDLNYNSEMLEFVSAKEGAILDPNANISIRNITNEKSYVRFTYMAPSSSVTSEGILLSVTFKALESSSGETDINITIPNPGDFVTGDLEKISYTVKNSKVAILNNGSAETPYEESTDMSEINTQPIESSSESTSEKPSNNNNNDNNSNKILSIVLLVFGVSLIFTGVTILVKKKKV